MQKLNDGDRLFSATDLVAFLGCHHKTVLDLLNLSKPLPKAPDTAESELLKAKGLKHEAAYLQRLREKHLSVVEIPNDLHLSERLERTRQAMNSGADIVFQAALRTANWHGYADFLQKVDRPSALGGFSYEVIDTKLAKHPEPKHVMQLCLYCELLEGVQGTLPTHMHLVLGDEHEESFAFAEFAYYFGYAKQRFEQFVANPPVDSYPEPCQSCPQCTWRELCAARWDEDDHLSRVANIQRSQIDKLRNARITTLAALAAVAPGSKIPDLNHEVLKRLHAQAALQLHKRVTGQDKHELLPSSEGRGFARLPMPDPGDLFFDMEGDPLHPEGLEYLFGLYYFDGNAPVFQPYWAHDHAEEKATFEQFMQAVGEHLALHPNAHIYHYNHYETTALKRLACRYAAAEEQLDNLLRQQKFVDLYKVVRESIRISEPGYSIKNLETFYMGKRDGEVATAGESIVVYNRWREEQDDRLLQHIAAYNEIDCISTHKLRDWLLGLRPANSPWFVAEQTAAADGQEATRKDWEIEYELRQQQLLDGAADEDRESRQRVAHLLEFHNREAKPHWWAGFERQGKYEDELIDDPECIGGLTMAGRPIAEKQSQIYTYSFPPQDFKFKVGDEAYDVELFQRAGDIVHLDEVLLIVKIKRGNKKGPLPERLSIGPPGPINTKVIRAGIYRVAIDVIEGKRTYGATIDLLSKAPPRLRGYVPGQDIAAGHDLEAEATDAVRRMDGTCLFIQGPPGAGKTYTTASILVALLLDGKRVGVSANSHKAIHNLLDMVEKLAEERKCRFVGIKKRSSGEETAYESRNFRSVADIGDIGPGFQFLAGTAWLFPDPRFDQSLDYLFIDEAGQVSLANVVAMGTAAKNIVLVGDQLQLGQPIQGVHPGEAGLSVLEFLLGDHSTIPPDRGIFLSNTYRLRPSICRFISDAFYDARLEPHAVTSQRSLSYSPPINGLPTEGIHFHPATHQGCSQKSSEEGAIINEYYHKLLGQQFRDERGEVRAITHKEILVVAPYNMQVNHLTSVLPVGARVGTVDKFQGQEAPVVLISLATSSPEDLPRHMEFLYSRNRLNVAISRAQCLAVVVANPRLLEFPCKTIPQMKLVNTLCWLHHYAEGLRSQSSAES